MASRDVKLVIRAKNEASKTLDSVANSLNKVDAAQAEVARSAKATDSSFSALSDEAKRLATQVEGLRAISAVSTELNRVRSTVDTMQKSIRNSADSFVKMAAEINTLGAGIEGLKVSSTSLTAAQKAQAAAAELARKETLKGSDATKAMLKTQRELAALVKKGTDTAAIARTTAEYDKAKAAVDRNAEAYKRLKAEYDKTSTELADVTAQIRTAQTQYDRLSRSANKLGSETIEANEALAKTQAELGKLDTRATASAKALGAISAEQADVATTTAKATAALENNAAALNAMKRYSTGGTSGFADPKTAATLREQRAVMDEVHRGWKALEADIASQAAAMRGLTAPTEAQVAAMRQTVQAARQAKAEYLGLAAVLERSEVAMRGTAATFDRGASHVRLFNQELRRTPSNPPLSPWRTFYNAIYGDSRKSMSMMQRLRGEVLALGTAYLGLYGTINQVGGVITAYQKLEAAQNRLGVVFQQNSSNVNTELGWLERQASRLGIEFGLLSDQYSKFAVAARTANFTAEGTRTVFLSVAEAGRVAKLSTEQLGGIFLALEQMISKGKIQSEELRRQLGDRLPGAFNIMAKALGVSTAALDDMMKKGKIIASEDNLIAFAKELDRQFGSQLPAALTSTTTLLGKMANSFYQAQLQVGRGGFIEGLNKGLRELNKWFESREGRDFFLSIGAALGKFTSGLAEVPKYFGLITTAVQTLISLKVAQFLIGIAGNFGTASAAARAAGTQMDLFGARTRTLGATLAATRAHFVNLATGAGTFATRLQAAGSAALTMGRSINVGRSALMAFNSTMILVTSTARAMWMAIGGLPGVLITGLTFLASTVIGNWIGGVDDATSAIDEHQRIVGHVITAYETLAKKTKAWQEGIENVSLAQAEGNFLKQSELYQKSLDELRDKLFWLKNVNIITKLFDNEQVTRVRSIVDAFDPTKLDEFVDSIVDLNSEISNVDAKKLLIDMLALAEKTYAAEGRMEDAAATAKTMGSILESLGMTAEEAAVRLEKMRAANQNVEEGLDEATEATTRYFEALNKMLGLIPSVAEEMKKLGDAAKFDEASLVAAAEALASGRGIGGLLNAYGQGMREIELAGLDTTPLVSSLDTNSEVLRAFYQEIKGKANLFSSGPNKVDQATLNSKEWRERNLATIETTGGMKAQVHKASAAAFQGFLNELEATGYNIKSFGGFNVRNKVGGTSTSEHGYGNAIDINPALNHFSDKLVTDLPKNIGLMAAKYGISWGGDWKGKKDAMHFEFTGKLPPGLEKVTDFDLAQQKEITVQRQKQREATEENLSASRQELANSKLITLGREREVEVRRAINEAMKKDADISAEDLGRIARIAGDIWDEKNVVQVQKAQREATAARLADMELEKTQQQMINDGKERQLAIDKAIAAAYKENPKATDEQIAKIAQLAAETYDLANAERLRAEARKKVEEEVNRLLEYRSVLQEILKAQMEQGDTAGAAATREVLQGVNAELQLAIQNAIAMWEAIGGPEADLAIAKLRQTQMEIAGASAKMGLFGLSTQQWGSMLASAASGMTGVFDKFARAIANGENAVEALGQAFLEFAANFLIEIGKMIIQQAILNMLQSFFPGIPIPGARGIGIPMGHTGGIVGASAIGSGNGTKNIFRNIPYYHDGGIVGLGPTEMMAVLEKNEEVLTRDDPRHILNGGASGGGGVAPAPIIKVVNSFDSGEVVSEGMNTPVGEQTFLNLVRKNASEIKTLVS